MADARWGWIVLLDDNKQRDRRWGFRGTDGGMACVRMANHTTGLMKGREDEIIGLVGGIYVECELCKSIGTELLTNFDIERKLRTL